MTVIAFPVPDRPCPRLHVWKCGDEWELHHQSASGDSWALVDRFPTREAAVRAALDALEIFPGARLGEGAA